MTSIEEEELNVKRMMEQSIPFHPDSLLLRDIYNQWWHGTVLSDRQKRAFINEMNHLQSMTLHHKPTCACQKHNIIFVTVHVLTAVQTFTGQDGVQYVLRPGNVVRLPLREAVALVMRRYADFQIASAFELSHEVYHHV